MAIEKASGYKCLEGTIHENLADCAACNVKVRLAEFVMGDMKDKNRTYILSQSGQNAEQLARDMPSEMFSALFTGEIKMVTHWVTKQPELLETIIRLYLEESGSDVLKGVKS